MTSSDLTTEVTSEMAASAAAASEASDVIEQQATRWPVAALGGVIAVLGLSGLIDDSGLIEHPWWVALVVAALVAAMSMIGRTLRSLLSVSTSDTPR